MQEEIIKNTIKLGNSSAVILPNSWKYRKVRIQLVEKSIIKDILEILLERDLLSGVIGIYLVGSYARNEEQEDSDVDLLIITDSINKQIKEGIYEITLISEEKFKERIGKSLYLTSMVNESKSLINDNFMRKYKKENTKPPLRKYIKEIKSLIRFNEENIKLDKEMQIRISDGVVYSLVLRLRELYLINSIILKKEASKKEFLNLINNKDLYEAYIRIKKDKKTRDKNSIEEVETLIDKMKKLIRKLEEKYGK